MIVFKYGLIFLMSFAIFGALIALRELHCPTADFNLNFVSPTAAVFRETLDLSCPFCDLL